MTTRMSEGALISYDEMEYRLHHARQVRAEFLGGGIADLLSAPLRQFKALARPLRRKAWALSASVVPPTKTAIQPAE